MGLFIARQPTDFRDRSDRESLCIAQTEQRLGRVAPIIYCNLHCPFIFKPDAELVLNEDATIGSTAERGERTRHTENIRNENQSALATEIDYFSRQSPYAVSSCGIITPPNS